LQKRPSRFDRQYLFPDPSREERVAYCHFWQSKLADNNDIEFPDKLCDAIADITEDFSFAYIQEAFVAALLAIARSEDGGSDSDTDANEDGWVLTNTRNDELSGLPLWVEIQKQVKILREGMERGKESTMS
jgi:transitional endoplasmic reticulum ATPase